MTSTDPYNLKKDIQGRSYDAVFWVWLLSSAILPGFHRMYLRMYASGAAMAGSYILGQFLLATADIFPIVSKPISLGIGVMLVLGCFFWWLRDGIRLFGMKTGKP